MPVDLAKRGISEVPSNRDLGRRANSEGSASMEHAELSEIRWAMPQSG